MAKDKKKKDKEKDKTKDKPKADKGKARWIAETFHPDWNVSMRVDKMLHEVKTDHQHLAIFENKTWGRVLILDGVFQLTTSDEFVYHEMMAHVPLMAQQSPARALVIGGGDGGVLREVLKHPSIKRAVLAEIDREVIDTSLKYYPEIANGAYDDPRTEVVIGDGMAYVAETDEKFDAIIVDSSEPIGPSAVLHSAEFFAACQSSLAPGGILITQNGLPFTAPEHLADVTTSLSRLFETVAPLTCTQPCYFGGEFALNTATDGEAPSSVPLEKLAGRAKRRKITTRYWTPAVHGAAFALPGYVDDVVNDARKAARKRTTARPASKKAIG